MPLVFNLKQDPAFWRCPVVDVVAGDDTPVHNKLAGLLLDLRRVEPLPLDLVGLQHGLHDQLLVLGVTRCRHLHAAKQQLVPVRQVPGIRGRQVREIDFLAVDLDGACGCDLVRQRQRCARDCVLLDGPLEEVTANRGALLFSNDLQHPRCVGVAKSCGFLKVGGKVSHAPGWAVLGRLANKGCGLGFLLFLLVLLASQKRIAEPLEAGAEAAQTPGQVCQILARLWQLWWRKELRGSTERRRTYLLKSADG